MQRRIGDVFQSGLQLLKYDALTSEAWGTESAAVFLQILALGMVLMWLGADVGRLPGSGCWRLRGLLAGLAWKARAVLEPYFKIMDSSSRAYWVQQKWDYDKCHYLQSVRVPLSP